VPGVYVEALFAKAPVPEPAGLSPEKVLTKCLHLDNFIEPALGLLIDEGLTEIEGQEGGLPTERVFLTKNELYGQADKLVKELVDDPKLVVKEGCFEWLEGFTNRAQDNEIKWFSTFTMEEVTKHTNDLSVYVHLVLMLGPRGTMEVRIERGSTFNTLVGGGGGGQLA